MSELSLEDYYKRTSSYNHLVGNFFRHFKGHVYYVTGISLNCETLTPQVEYICVNPNTGMKWVREATEFTAPVDKEKYPDVQQKWRFQHIPNYLHADSPTASDLQEVPAIFADKTIDKHTLVTRLVMMKRANVTKFMGKSSRYFFDYIINFIGAFPVTNSAPVREAVWIKEWGTRTTYSCSACGKTLYYSGEKVDLKKFPYCHCGCKMKNEGDE